MMNSSLLDGTEVSIYDDSLRVAIGFDGTLPVNFHSPFLVGIENELGQIYRLVGVDDLKTLLEMLNRLNRLNYVVENMQAESVGDITAIIKVPKYSS